MVASEQDPDFQSIAIILKNFIPQGRQYLKSLRLVDSDISIAGTVDYAQLSTSLIKVIEVRFHTLTEKASPGMSVLNLIFNNMPETVNLDSSLDIIFKLDQIASLCLIWNQMYLHKIKSSLRKQGRKKRWEMKDMLCISFKGCRTNSAYRY
jgi:hypothetical protein